MEFVVENFGVLSTDAAHIQELKNLVLDMAFRGKLTNQTSEDESGELLLQRIKSKQEQLNKEGRIGKLTKYKSLGEDEIPFEIPESWIWCRLGELGENQTGTTPSRSNPEYYGTFIPFLGPGDLQNGVINYQNKALSKLGIEKGRLIKKESILMVCIGGSIGKSVLVDRDVSCNQQINTITPVIALSDYLHYGMQATFFQTSLLEKASGSATPIINKGKWERLPFPLAPLPEQRRIVQKVNHLFRQIDALAAGAEQAEGVRRRLRAALLHRLEQAPGRAAAGRAWAQLEEQFGMVLRRVEDVQALRQSILQLAVKGLLVEQDPDLPAPQANKYWVYVIKCSNDSNYIGQTGNLRKRWRAHLNGEGADWTKRYPPQYLLYWEVFDSREEAVNKEKWLKTGFGRKWIKREEAANRLWRAGEPAWVLLERIKEEKARLVEEGKIRKQKALPAVAEEEMPFEAPEGWVWCRLGDIMHNLQTGPFGSSLPKSEYVENGIPVINPKSIKNEKITPIPKMAISEKTLKRLISFKLNEGDIIMARRGEMGRCALITKIESGWLCGTGSLVITLPKEIFKPYFVKFLGSHYVKTYLLNASVGSTMNNLNQRILLNLPFPLPPLAEQRRIVERVEGLLGWCERLEAAMGEREEKEGRLVRAGLRVDMYP